MCLKGITETDVTVRNACKDVSLRNASKDVSVRNASTEVFERMQLKTCLSL
jgi:hypothetical protein